MLEVLNEKRTSVVQMVKLAEKEIQGLEKATKLVSENNTTEIADIQAAISSLETYVKSERGTDIIRRSRNEEFERQNLKDREDFNHLKKKIKKLDDKLERDATKIVDHTKECEDSVIEIPKLEEKIGQLQTLLVNEEKILEEIEENSKCDSSLKLETQNAICNSSRTGARQKVVELSSTMESVRNKGSVLKAIIRPKEANDIPGIYGRMGDLGAIGDEKQAYYLPRMREKIDTPEGVPRLFDLIKVKDERMKLAFFFAALGNIIVAKDIDQLSNSYCLWWKEWIVGVVTLDGALFEKSGAMTGGGNRPSGGKVGTSIRASASTEAVANAEKELSDLVERLKNLRNRISDAVKN
ncbi:Structural maintenance of chromosomes protein 4 [Orobanche hederae]